MTVPSPYWARNERPAPKNEKPLIGILSQPGDGQDGETAQEKTGGGGGESCKGKGSEVSYIVASYVKWIESAGARAVPILYNEPKEVIEKKFRAVNGLLIPGGNTPLVPGPFFDAVQLLFNLALEANDAGDYFPVQGTCMGFQAMIIDLSHDYSLLERHVFKAHDQATTLTFAGNWAKQRSMFSWMTPDLVTKLETTNITLENHEDGFTLDHFRSSEKLTSFFDVLTTSKDLTGKEYVSTIEAKHYPFFGTQWHPEKSAYEWGMPHIPHSAEAIAVTQAAANFFVNEARRSLHAPGSEDELEELVIFNYTPIFSGKHGNGHFEQSYIFKNPTATS